MTQQTEPLVRRALLALALAVSASQPLAAQEVAIPALTSAAQYAPAVLRQDIIPGTYELLDTGAPGGVFVASTASFGDKTPGYVYLLNREDLSPIRRTQLSRGAFALAMDGGAGRLYVGNTLDGSLTVIDAASGLPTGTIELGQPLKDGGVEHVRMIGVDQQTHRVYVTGPSDKGVLWIVDGAAGKVLQRVDDTGLWSAGLVVDSENSRIYVSGGGIEEIGVFDAETGARLAGISTGDTTEAGPEASQHFFVNLALDAQGQRLFAADANSGQLYVFEAGSGKVLAKVPTGLGTLDVAYNPVRDEIYVTWRGATREKPNGTGGLAVIDGKNYALKHNLSLPVHPNSLEVSDDGDLLFVTVKAAMDKDHPEYRNDAADSVLRFDLAKLDLIGG